MYLLYFGPVLLAIGFTFINPIVTCFALEHFAPRDLNQGSGTLMMTRWMGSVLGASMMGTFYLFQKSSLGMTSGIIWTYSLLIIINLAIFVLSFIFITYQEA